MKIKFFAELNGKSIALNKEYGFAKKEQIQFDNLKFYVSNIQLRFNSKAVYVLEQSILIDFADLKTAIAIPVNSNLEWDEITFDIGIDSLCNVSGEMNHDLDPIKGMYWTWQSGYINFKLEGSIRSSKKIKNEFHYHIGGYRLPFYPLLHFTFPVQNKESLSLAIDLGGLVKSAKDIALFTVMSPGENAMILSRILARSIAIKR